jgi:hypothetical protein
MWFEFYTTILDESFLILQIGFVSILVLFFLYKCMSFFSEDLFYNVCSLNYNLKDILY